MDQLLTRILVDPNDVVNYYESKTLENRIYLVL